MKTTQRLKNLSLSTISRSIRSLFLVGLLACIVPQADAAKLRSGFPLMMENADARLLALGGSAITETGFAGNMPNNPASIYGSNRLLSATFARHPFEMWSGRILGSGVIEKYNWGVFVQSYDYGTFKESLSNSGETGRTFGATENLFGATIAGDLLGWGSWGVTGKVDWSNLDNKSYTAAAIDAGLTYDPHWENFGLGLVVRNFGTEFGSSTSDEIPTPTEISLGAAKQLKHLPLKLHTVVHVRRKGEGDYDLKFLKNEPGLAFGAGGEFAINPQGAGKPFFLRFGYHSEGRGLRVGNSSDTLAGFSFGLGMMIRRFTFDYAFGSMGALGQVHRLGISSEI